MPAGAKPIIVAVDDDVVILRVVADILQEEYSIRPFVSGEKALRYLADQTADLILLDYRMPGLTGLEVLQKLHTSPRTSEIPAIVLTGALDDESEVLALEMGAVDYIQKPVRPQALMKRVGLQLELQAHRRHLEALVRERTGNLNEAYNKLKIREDITLALLARATEMRDRYTGNHIERTTELVGIIVESILTAPSPEYALTSLEADDIVRSAKLHDLGKIATPDNILLKPGRLTAEEFEVIKLHPVCGERLLSDCLQRQDDPFLNMARCIAYGHHERWDGSGYPLGLKGAEIPLPARIVAIADVYDALTSPRPYKEPNSHEESMDIIRRDSGSHFDPYLAAVFDRQAEKIARIGPPSALVD